MWNSVPWPRAWCSVTATCCPAVNPDSEIAKQQELVLKERAHIMAQRQDQEQAALLAAAESERRQEQQ